MITVFDIGISAEIYQYRDIYRPASEVRRDFIKFIFDLSV